MASKNTLLENLAGTIYTNTVLQAVTQTRLYISLARTQAEIEEAQRLRYKVFAEEMGAQLSGTGGLDIDGFDQFCDHLIVRDSGTN